MEWTDSDDERPLSWRQNEPEGMTPINERPFNDGKWFEKWTKHIMRQQADPKIVGMMWEKIRAELDAIDAKEDNRKVMSLLFDVFGHRTREVAEGADLAHAGTIGRWSNRDIERD